MSESSKNQDAFRDSGCVLYFLLDYIMAKDLEKINSLQQNLVQLELEVLNEKNLDIIKEITNYRSRTMKLHHYYVQLEGILQDLEDDISDLISNEAKRVFQYSYKKNYNVWSRIGTDMGIHVTNKEIFISNSWTCIKMRL